MSYEFSSVRARIGLSSMAGLICLAILSLRSAAEAARKRKTSGTGWSHRSAWLAVRRVLIPVVLSFILLLNSRPAFAQDKATIPNLLDMNIEHLMSIEVDSVY